MPFTLLTDMLLAVHPEAAYAKVRVEKETWILVKQRVEPVMQELGIEKYEVTETVMGNRILCLQGLCPSQFLLLRIFLCRVPALLVRRAA